MIGDFPERSIETIEVVDFGGPIAIGLLFSPRRGSAPRAVVGSISSSSLYTGLVGRA